MVADSAKQPDIETRRLRSAGLSDGLEEIATRSQGSSPSSSPNPRDETSKSADVAGPSPACWLCNDLGGIALHIKASEAWGRELYVAHTLMSDSHPVYPCPACALRDLTEASN